MKDVEQLLKYADGLSIRVARKDLLECTCSSGYQYTVSQSLSGWNAHTKVEGCVYQICQDATTWQEAVIAVVASYWALGIGRPSDIPFMELVQTVNKVKRV